MLLLAATVIGVLRGEDMGELQSALAQCRTDWIVCAAGCVALFILSAAFGLWLMLRSREMGLSLWKCFLSACVEFFFSAVTPSASGGQPMQIYYLRKKGVPVSVSTVSLLTMTIAYKLTLVLTGLVLAVMARGMLRQTLGGMMFLFWIGLALFTAWTVFLLLVVFRPGLARAILIWGMSVLEELHLLKNRRERQTALEVAMDMYSDTADHLRTHPLLLLEVFGVSILRRGALLSVTWCVYRSLGLSGVSWPMILLLQAVVSICADMLPLPGGMGVTEGLFVKVFAGAFGTLAVPGMILSRGIGHYAQLILCGLFTMLALVFVNRSGRMEE